MYREKKNDEFLFVNDSQVKRIIDSGEDPFTKSISVSRLGRGIGQILRANSIKFTDSDLKKQRAGRTAEIEESRIQNIKDHYKNIDKLI